MKFQEALEKIKEKILRLIDISGSKFPIYKDYNSKEWVFADGKHWISPFWCGILWNIGSYFSDEKIIESAIKCSFLLTAEEDIDTHDRGFKYFYSTVKGWELTNYTKFKEISLRGANDLANMFNPSLGFIPLGSDVRFPGEPPEVSNYEFIIDTMTASLPLLLWAYKVTSEPKFYYISIIHAHRTFDLLIRKDWSTYHAVRILPSNGEVYRHTHQGYSNESCWSRGQAWAIYGFTKLYEETHLRFFLVIAEKLLEYFIKNLPINKIPFYDFTDPLIPNVRLDTSASAIVSSAMLDLYKLTGNNYYIINAIDMIRALLRNEVFVDGGLQHSRYRQGEAEDAEIMFGDYYLSEALIKALYLGFQS
ncbi:glycosyl hydrolase [Sulfolobus sp. E5-1-F]|uniref:glycoside hydrolase family 88 protein n=1 Tax=Saccharolobus sp. E5-1-F TaxID=2663019 RepID=UPI001294FBA4|nr:glycoside hydrolase family 88 protein [Sulfolobus sp. E5-1-F]QGA55319.1 glycosyl hydrolase [Sulfolobus sp. E5-1-F]